MALKRYILLYLLLINPAASGLFAQESNGSESLISIAEELAADENEPALAELFVEILSELNERPVEINSCDPDELRRLFFLTDFQLKVLMEYVKTNGNIVSINELAILPGYNNATAEMVSPFISLENGLKKTITGNSASHQLISNLALKNSHPDVETPGSPLKSMIKYRFKAGILSAGLTAEKDPGEKLLTGKPAHPDFISANLSLSGTGIIRKIIIGDYSARFGFGTSLNTGFITGNSISSALNYSVRDDIRPHGSAEENRFLRGLASNFRIKRSDISIFLSSNKADGTLATNEDKSTEYVRSLAVSGLHNSPSLVSGKDVLLINSLGLSASYSGRTIKTGLLFFTTNLSIPIIPDTTEARNLHNFRGTRNRLVSAYFSTVINRIIVAGELSYNPGSAPAIIQTLTFRPDNRLNVSTMFKYIPPGFHSVYGYVYGSPTLNGNETSFTGQFMFEAARHLFISAGCEYRRYPWLRYRNSNPSDYTRYEIKLRFLKSANFSFESLLSHKNFSSDRAEIQGIPVPIEQYTSSIKIQSVWRVNEVLKLSSRLDYKILRPAGSRGFLMQQDIVLTPGKIPFSFWFRYSIFNTDDYYSGIYTWENDLLYSFSIPVMYGRGNRFYLMTQWRAGKVGDIRIKYGWTSVFEQVNKWNLREEIKLQLSLRF